MADDVTEQAVSAYYGGWDLVEAIERALRGAGIDPARVSIEQLAPLDHFHSFGMAGTLELARAAGIANGDRVLDVGGGIGGPARLLASRYGCAVTVLDLTPAFCEAGKALTAWTDLADRVSFVCASALEMPFADGSFDVAWTQHAAMNIADKPRLYAEVHRVLRPGGHFALFDVMAGPNQPIHFPVPWASDQTSSFLLPPDEVCALVTGAGFVERTWLAGPELAKALGQAAPGATSSGVPTGEQLNLGMLIGSDADQRFANIARNTQEGRVSLGLGVFERV
jgi:SAM-dependent methyltransferase